MGCVSLVKRLILEGRDPFEESWIWGSSTYIAAYKGNNELLEMFFAGVPPGEIAGNNTKAVQGANFSSRLDTLDLILQPRWGCTWPTKGLSTKALRGCQWNKTMEIVMRMADELAPHDPCYAPSCFPKNHLPALIDDAARRGYMEKVRTLLQMGAPSDQFDGDWSGMPLSSACEAGQNSIVQLLLQYGANPNSDYRWRCPLLFAARGGYLNIVEMLLNHGADVNKGYPPPIVSFTGADKSVMYQGLPAPIVSAIKQEFTAMFQLLRGRGAVLDTPNTGGYAMSEAIEMGLDSMVGLLLQEGVVIDKMHVALVEESGHEGVAFVLEQHLSRANRSDIAIV